jgi:hypothetical protein
MSRENVGSRSNEKYSQPMPRTKPEMMRPRVTTSSMAISSATRSGFARSGRPFPRIAIFAFFVRRANIPAMMFGEGIRP